MLVPRITSTQHVVKDVLKGRRDRANLAIADLIVIDAHDRRDLRGGATGEHLVRQVQLGAVNLPLLDLQPKHLAREHDQRITGNAFKDATANVRSDQLLR